MSLTLSDGRSCSTAALASPAVRAASVVGYVMRFGVFRAQPVPTTVVARITATVAQMGPGSKRLIESARQARAALPPPSLSDTPALRNVKAHMGSYIDSVLPVFLNPVRYLEKLKGTVVEYPYLRTESEFDDILGTDLPRDLSMRQDLQQVRKVMYPAEAVAAGELDGTQPTAAASVFKAIHDLGAYAVPHNKAEAKEIAALIEEIGTRVMSASKKWSEALMTAAARLGPQDPKDPKIVEQWAKSVLAANAELRSVSRSYGLLVDSDGPCAPEAQSTACCRRHTAEHSLLAAARALLFACESAQFHIAALPYYAGPSSSPLLIRFPSGAIYPSIVPIMTDTGPVSRSLTERAEEEAVDAIYHRDSARLAVLHELVPDDDLTSLMHTASQYTV